MYVMCFISNNIKAVHFFTLYNKEKKLLMKANIFNRGAEITTVNQTFPINIEGKICAAVEIADAKMERLMRTKVRAGVSRK